MSEKTDNIKQAYAMLNRFLERYDNLSENAIAELELIITLLREEVKNG